MHGALAIWSGGFAFTVNKYVKKSCNRTIHAEISALGKVPRKYQNNCFIIVWRVHPDGHLSMSKPCEKCQKYLRRKKIKLIYYSTDEQKFGRYYNF